MEEVREIEAGFIYNHKEFGDTLENLAQYEEQAEEQGGMSGALGGEECGTSEVHKLNKKHVAKVMMVLAPGCMAVGFSMCYAS